MAPRTNVGGPNSTPSSVEDKKLQKNEGNAQASPDPPPQQLQDDCLLAPSYVPLEWRNIHRGLVGAVWPTLMNPMPIQTPPTGTDATATTNTNSKIDQSNPASKPFHEFQSVFLNLVATPPQCCCPPGLHKPHFPPVFPWLQRPQLPVDREFGLLPTEEQEKQRKQRRTAAPLAATEGPEGISPLNRLENLQVYIKAFKSWLRDEYDEHLLLYERYSQYQMKPQLVEGAPRAILHIRGMADARPSLQSGDSVVLRTHPTMRLPLPTYPFSTPHQMRIEVRSSLVSTIRGTARGDREMSPDRIVLTWLPAPQAALLQNIPLAVRFLPSTILYERCFAALAWLESLHPDVAHELLFPSHAPQLPQGTNQSYHINTMKLHDAAGVPLNDQQTKFVRTVLERTAHPSVDMVRPPMVLTGPAGTGKTKALLVSILQVLSSSPPDPALSKRVLVCTPSHTACDVVTRRLGKALKREQIFRLYDVHRPVEMVPVDVLPFTRQGPQGEFILPPAHELLGFQVIVCTCSDAHLLTLAGLTNSSLRQRRQCFQTYVERCLAQSGLQLNGTIEGVTRPHFSHLFIDEAAQATEPETLIPFSVVVDDAPNIAKVEISLSGDPRQLNPDTYSSWAACGLQVSLLERLLQLPNGGGRRDLLGPPTKDNWRTIEELIEFSFYKETAEEDEKASKHMSIFLITNYRGHPSFLYMPSKLFYFDKLRSIRPDEANQDSAWCSHLRKVESLSTPAFAATNEKQWTWPIHFCGVKGRDVSMAVEAFCGSNSWANAEEANMIVTVIETLVGDGVLTQSIGVMAAFRAQVVLIRKLLRIKHLGSVNVGMVEDYQAVERDIIILSLTRSKETFVESDVGRRSGLFHQPKRVNVALTRAENLLIVVGNPSLMKTDPIWNEWLKFCERNGLWYGTSAG